MPRAQTHQDSQDEGKGGDTEPRPATWRGAGAHGPPGGTGLAVKNKRNPNADLAPWPSNSIPRDLPKKRETATLHKGLCTSVLETANAGQGPGPTPRRTDGQTAERPRRDTPSRRGASATGAPEKLGNAPPGERSRTQTRTRQPSPLHETLTDKHAR